MNLKRVLTGLIGFPIVTMALIFGNKYIMDVLITLIALISMYEYIDCLSKKDIKVIKWVSYIVILAMAFIHVIPSELYSYLYIIPPVLLFILFLHVIISNMKITFLDISFTLFGIFYIFGFLVFFPLIYGLDGDISGKLLIWFIFTTSWGTDLFAYLVGMKFGKNRFSKVSPKKSVEGCIGGTIAAIILTVVFAMCFNKFFNTNIAYIKAIVFATFLSIIGQIGDFSASVIKRYCEVKDFSGLFPGHGGMIDRIDSVMFICPFAYFLFTILL